MISRVLIFALLFSSYSTLSQSIIKGKVVSEGKPVEFASVGIQGTAVGTHTDKDGMFSLSVSSGQHTLRISSIGYITKTQTVNVSDQQPKIITINLQQNESQLNEVVVTGTMKESFKSESPVPIEVITAKFFLKNPSPTIFESLNMVNGVQPQLNCNVCNTGDIHINGMEGPYTMITIDGMPIVSALSTVYGLNGIPSSMVQRIEVVKGPASTLYGSEAVGGLINIITKDPANAPKLAVDVFATSNHEINNDLSLKARIGKSSTLLGINYFNFKNKMDKNKDNFTDLTLQDRISIFNKWTFDRKEGRHADIASRWVYEDRWGGEMEWTPAFRGGDSIYGESIYTNRFEMIGKYDLPISEKISLNFSVTNHDQNSVYGATSYIGKQNISFLQLLWEKELKQKHNLIVGIPLRYTFYDDNTVGTASDDPINPKNRPQNTFLPGIFVQDEIKFSKTVTTLAGIRYDYNSDHGSIFSPRLSIKQTIAENNTLRLGVGNGYRVVNLFTEDHAALTGSRKVIIEEQLKPEQSYNINANYTGFINHSAGFVGIDASIFYTYFTNKIIGDFLTSPDAIIYKNLQGYSISKGISLNLDFQFMFPLKVLLGGTLMDVYSKEENKKIPQIHAPNFTGNFVASYTFQSIGVTIDYTGKVTSPMHLPVIENDFRASKSPWFSIQNIQVTKKLGHDFQVYGGVKNLLNFVPKDPITRWWDPFEKSTQEAPDNRYPDNIGFDTTYNYAPLVGTYCFLGARYSIR